MRRTGVVCAALVIGIVVAGSCTRPDTASRAPSPTPDDSVKEFSQTTATQRRVITSEQADLLAPLLTADVPDGFVRQPDDYADNGPSDKTKAVADDRQPDAAAAFDAMGFVAGYQRLWQTKDKQQIILFLYEFGTDDGAK